MKYDLFVISFRVYCVSFEKVNYIIKPHNKELILVGAILQRCECITK